MARDRDVLTRKWAHIMRSGGLNEDQAQFLAQVIEAEAHFMRPNATRAMRTIGRYVLPVAQKVGAHCYPIRGLLLRDRDPRARLESMLHSSFVQMMTATDSVVDVVGSLENRILWETWNSYRVGMADRLLTKIREEVEYDRKRAERDRAAGADR